MDKNDRIVVEDRQQTRVSAGKPQARRGLLGQGGHSEGRPKSELGLFLLCSAQDHLCTMYMGKQTSHASRFLPFLCVLGLYGG